MTDPANLLHLEGQPLTITEAAQKLSVTESEVKEMVLVYKKLFSIHDLDGKQDLFPAFQFTDNGVLPGLRRVLNLLNEYSSWTKLTFFHTPNDRLNNRTPLQALRDGDAEAVADEAKAYGAQGSKLIPVKCPVCGRNPTIAPVSPKQEGDAWGEVRCWQEDHCLTVSDGQDVADDRESEAYVEIAITRWNQAFSKG